MTIRDVLLAAHAFVASEKERRGSNDAVYVEGDQAAPLLVLIDEALVEPRVNDARHPHLIDGEFQSDKYPTTPRGKVPLSVKDPTAQDLIWEYAQRRRKVDAEFAADLEIALRLQGYIPGSEKMDEAMRQILREELRLRGIDIDTANQWNGALLLACLRAMTRVSVPSPQWIIGDGLNKRFRCWGDSGPEWTDDREKALHFARRQDAEAFAENDEDAWSIMPVHLSPGVENMVKNLLSRSIVKIAMDQMRVDSSLSFTPEDRMRRILGAALTGTVDRAELTTSLRQEFPISPEAKS